MRMAFRDSAKDVLFDMFKGPEDTVPIGKFLSVLSLVGLRHTDPRLREMKERLTELLSPDGLMLDILDHNILDSRLHGQATTVSLNREDFRRVVDSGMPLLSRAFRGKLALPNFGDFCSRLNVIFERCRNNDSGKIADYIPQLAFADPTKWGVSVCSVDGQRFSLGDARVPFTLQSMSKPLTYALCLEHLGSQKVHGFVGQEPSGRMFNELVLDDSHRPHNPMVNSGAIVVCSLLKQLLYPEMSLAQKFEFILKFIQKLAGDKKVGFNNAVFVSEREAGDRNYALAFLMREYKCYPERPRLRDIMELYFQCCSMEMDCDALAVVGATLAHGGVCPLTGDRVLSTDAVGDTLSLMHSCGMYDYSGHFAFKVGIPAKSGVSGGILAVVPNLLGLACWSPPLDRLGNTARGLQFCEELVAEFGFHPYAHFRAAPGVRREDPVGDVVFPARGVGCGTRGTGEQAHSKRRYCAQLIAELMLAAREGDVAALRGHLLAGHDLIEGLADVDGRTVLHVAAAEGHQDAVSLLLERCGFLAAVKDRWGRLPLDDAKQFGHVEVAAALERYTPPEMDAVT